MSFAFNSVTIAGNLTRDPELRFTKSGTAVCGFSVAINQKYKDKESVVFMDVSVWSEQGENVSKYLKKGSPVLISGRLDQQSWEDHGNKRSKIVIVANSVVFVPTGEGKRDHDDDSGGGRSRDDDRQERRPSRRNDDDDNRSRRRQRDDDDNRGRRGREENDDVPY